MQTSIYTHHELSIKKKLVETTKKEKQKEKQKEKEKEKKVKSFVYLWRDSLFKKYYIGYTCGWRPNYICSSVAMLTQYKVRPHHFKRRILQYGTRKEMVKLEERLLKSRFKYFGSRYYNLALSFPLIIFTDEVRRKMSIARKRRPSPMKGRKHSEKTKRNWSMDRIGKAKPPRSDEHLRNLSKALKGRTGTMKGKKASEESLRRMSIAQKKWRALKSYTSSLAYQYNLLQQPSLKV